MDKGETVGYASRLGLKPSSTVQLVELIDRGLAFRAFQRLQADMGLSHAELAGLVGISARTLARRKTEGRLNSRRVGAAGAGLAHLQFGGPPA